MSNIKVRKRWKYWLHCHLLCFIFLENTKRYIMKSTIKRKFNKEKLENVEWFSRFTLLERMRIKIARKNMRRARRLRGLALKKRGMSKANWVWRAGHCQESFLKSRFRFTKSGFLFWRKWKILNYYPLKFQSFVRPLVSFNRKFISSSICLRNGKFRFIPLNLLFNIRLDIRTQTAIGD